MLGREGREPWAAVADGACCVLQGRLNKLPAATIGDMVMCSVKKGKPELRKKVMPGVVVRQRKTFRRKDGIFLYFEDNAGESLDEGLHARTRGLGRRSDCSDRILDFVLIRGLACHPRFHPRFTPDFPHRSAFMIHAFVCRCDRARADFLPYGN